MAPPLSARRGAASPRCSDTGVDEISTLRPRRALSNIRSKRAIFAFSRSSNLALVPKLGTMQTWDDRVCSIMRVERRNGARGTKRSKRTEMPNRSKCLSSDAHAQGSAGRTVPSGAGPRRRISGKYPIAGGRFYDGQSRSSAITRSLNAIPDM